MGTLGVEYDGGGVAFAEGEGGLKGMTRTVAFRLREDSVSLMSCARMTSGPLNSSRSAAS